MKTLFFISAFYAVQALAAIDPRLCETTSKTHHLAVQEVADGVAVRFEQSQLTNFGDIGTAKKYKISGKSIDFAVIHGLTLTDALKDTSAVKGVLVSMMRSRPEFAGEEDMSYGDAENYIRALVCK